MLTMERSKTAESADVIGITDLTSTGVTRPMTLKSKITNVH